MTEDVILKLTELLCKEHKEGTKDKFIITKEELIRFCIKMMKVIERCENGLTKN